MTLWLLLIAHFVGDFYLQTTKLAEKKTQKMRYLLLHGLIYAVVLTIGFCAISARAFWLPYTIAVGSHIVVDYLRVLLDRKFSKNGFHFASFVVDQAIHICVLICLSFIYSLDSQVYPWVVTLSSQITLDILLRYVLIGVIILQPASVLVKKLSAYATGSSGGAVPGSAPAVGSIIGMLERMLIVVLVLCGEIGAIGFVLTAKSLARHSQLNQQDFAEKYLVGTLASAAVAIAVAMVLK